MNIECRIKILSKSLEIEEGLSSVLKEIIKVPKADTKTLGNRSSSLSFKTKADLLHDLNRITTEEYRRLILFMEIRNQFIHNINGNSFTKVFEFIGNDRKKYLLRINHELAEFHDLVKDEKDKEKILEFGFDFLSIKLLETIISIREQIIKDFENEREQENLSSITNISMDMLNYVQETIDEFGDIWTKELDKSSVRTDFKDIMSSYIHQKSIEKLRTKYPELPESI